VGLLWASSISLPQDRISSPSSCISLLTGNTEISTRHAGH
jgi:hypothetical protein